MMPSLLQAPPIQTGGVAQHLRVRARQVGALELSVGAVCYRAAVRRPERFNSIFGTRQKFYFGGIEVADVEHPGG
jgi:hypothetical protein